MDRILKGFLKLAEEAMVKDEEMYTKKFRKYAVDQFGWGDKVAGYVKVKAKKFRYNFEHPVDAREEVLTQEHGNENQRPSAAMLNFGKAIENGKI